MSCRILLSGLPGPMATEVARLLIGSPEGERLLPLALTGKQHDGQQIEVSGRQFELVGPARRDELAMGHEQSDSAEGSGLNLIAIDFSTPHAMEDNARWYCEHGVPFVMGTTGGDTDAISKAVKGSSICAVVAPNMAIPIVLIQAAAEHLAREFPHALTGYRFQLTESHQCTKRDTSGTAKAMVKHLAGLGLPATVEGIERIRAPERQRAEMGVPEEHFGGHAFHRYETRSVDGTVRLELRHDVVGRSVYAEGALVALRFLERRGGVRGQVFSMQEVLKG